MDVLYDIDAVQSFISWPNTFLEDQILYFEDSSPPDLLDLAPPVFNDSYDLLPLPECLDQKPFMSFGWACAAEEKPASAHISPAGADPSAGGVENDRKMPPTGRKTAGRRAARLGEIGLEEMRTYFDMPITQAAAAMNIGLTVLKKRCRDLGISRWPHRKMKSLNTLISNIQELGKCYLDANISKELRSLEEHRKLMEENPELQLTEKTKKLRQTCFKANYKRRVAMQRPYLQHIQTVNPFN